MSLQFISIVLWICLLYAQSWRVTNSCVRPVFPFICCTALKCYLFSFIFTLLYFFHFLSPFLLLSCLLLDSWPAAGFRGHLASRHSSVDVYSLLLLLTCHVVSWGLSANFSVCLYIYYVSGVLTARSCLPVIDLCSYLLARRVASLFFCFLSKMSMHTAKHL